MAAGLGFKTFVTGEVLTAADTNGYLMQGVNVFADAAARTAAITSPQEGQMSYLKDTNSTEYYSGSAWVAVGAAGGGMTLLSTTTFSTGTVSLTSISADYVDLVLVISQMYGSSDGAELDIQFNTDTGANYGNQRGTTLVDGQTSIRVLDMITTSVQYEKQCNGMIVIPRYSTNMRKFCQISLSASAAATDLYSLNQGLYNSTNAISSIQLKTSAGTFSGGTVFLYGVK